MTSSSIPIFPTPFVGRQNELAQITHLLAEPNCRLLTLLGPGGMGKTRLAVEAAQLQQERFANGIYFAALQPLTSPDLIIQAIADALQLHFYPGGDPKQQLLDWLHDKQLLLVMDNFEHLLDGVAIISDLLNSAPRIKVMTTSRERLNLMEEWTFDVGGLSVPQSSEEQHVDGYDAIRLFVQSAQRVQVGFHLTEAQQEAVSRICQLVGGMPLGIEMAAAWVRSLSCDEIATEIEHGIDILATTARNVPPRHRSMRVALDHSWALLTPLEQYSFKWLSVFRGGFTREAATFVSGASVWTLTALVDKSLLRVDAHGKYHMQELLRQYAEEQLELAAEALSARELHADYYAEFLRQRWEPLKSQHQPQALGEIDAQLDNIRAAWHTLCQQHKVTAIRDAAPSLWIASDLRCRFYDMVSLFSESTAALRSMESTTEVNRSLGLILALQGWSHVGIGLPDKGQQLAEEGVAILEAYGVSEALFLSLLSLQLTTNYHNQPQALRQVSEKAIAVARQLGNDWGIARAWYEVSNFTLGEAENPQISEAERHERCEATKIIAEECLKLAEACGDPWLRASVSGFLLGNVYHVLDNYAEAKKQYEQSIPLFETVGQSWAIGAVHRLLGFVTYDMQDYAAALHHYRTSLEVFYRNGQVHEQITTLYGFGELLITQGDKTGAVALFTVIAEHPGTLDFIKPEAIQVLQQLKTEIAADSYHAAVERGKSQQLQDVLMEILAERSEEASQPFSPLPSIPDALTKRELEILKLMSSGMNNREIAAQLVLSVGTVKWYSSQILSKLHAQNRVQALSQARALNLLS